MRAVIKTRMQTPADGAATSLYCATSPDVAACSGNYYDECSEKEPSKRATPELGAELWEKSEEWTSS
ncbi:MAG: hypothetical protein JO050_07775 [Acidimicrobiia bacterium]|nr:hypothetical protein [Acidimicrobiia bacterium]